MLQHISAGPVSGTDNTCNNIYLLGLYLVQTTDATIYMCQTVSSIDNRCYNIHLLVLYLEQITDVTIYIFQVCMWCRQYILQHTSVQSVSGIERTYATTYICQACIRYNRYYNIHLSGLCLVETTYATTYICQSCIWYRDNGCYNIHLLGLYLVQKTDAT